MSPNGRKCGFPRLDLRGVPLLPARAQRLRITRLCRCRAPPDVVTVSVQGTPRRRDLARALRARPSRGSSRSAWGKGPEGRTPAYPARADSFPGSPPCPFPSECPSLLRGPHLPELRGPRGRTGVAGECARVPGCPLGREGSVGKRWTQDRETLVNFTTCGDGANPRRNVPILDFPGK